MGENVSDATAIKVIQRKTACDFRKSSPKNGRLPVFAGFRDGRWGDGPPSSATKKSHHLARHAGDQKQINKTGGGMKGPFWQTKVSQKKEQIPGIFPTAKKNRGGSPVKKRNPRRWIPTPRRKKKIQKPNKGWEVWSYLIERGAFYLVLSVKRRGVKYRKTKVRAHHGGIYHTAGKRRWT